MRGDAGARDDTLIFLANIFRRAFQVIDGKA